MPSLFSERLEPASSPYINRFVQPDTIIPDLSNPQSWNRYSYVTNRPVKFKDPTGHIEACDKDDWACQYHWDIPIVADDSLIREKKHQEELLPLIFMGSGPDGTWTQSDWESYYKYEDWIWGNPELWKRGSDANLTEKGWDLFALHVSRLTSHYGPDERDLFVRDFALVFGGVPSEGDLVSAGLSAADGPVLRYLNYSNEGLNNNYLDSLDETENQSHHYAGIFPLGYFMYEPTGSGVAVAEGINFARDVYKYNPGDLNLGYAAIAQGAYISSGVGDFSDLSFLLSELK